MAEQRNRRSSSCTRSSGAITRATRRWKSSRAPSLRCWPGQSVALVAPSGAGKSTLLHIAGLLEQPDGGEVYLDGAPTSALSDAARTRLRRTEIGFVYQAHHLLPEFSAVENVMLPQMIRGLSRAEARKRATELLTYLGLRRAADAPAGRIVRRRAAARRDRARGRQCAARPAGRRADRQSRPAHRRTMCSTRWRSCAASGLAVDHRHPQHGPRRAHGPAGDHPRRAGGGD